MFTFLAVIGTIATGAIAPAVAATAILADVIILSIGG